MCVNLQKFLFMQKFRRKDNKKVGYYTFAVKELGHRSSIVEDYFYYETSERDYDLHPSIYGEFALFSVEFMKDLEKANKFFLKTIAKAPKDSFWTGNYAVFLHYYLQDFAQAEKYYRRSLYLNKKDPFVMYNYAILLVFWSREYDLAEKMIKKAIMLDPETPKLKCFYASFLFIIRNNYSKSEKICRELTEIFNTNPRWLAVYAQLKLLQKDYSAADKLIKKAFKLDPTDDVKLALWFFRYAHYVETIQKAEFEMNKLLKAGVKTPIWGLFHNAMLAILDGHEYPEKLQEYAKNCESVFKV